MLLRILAFLTCCALALVACKRSLESSLVGTWRGTTAESAGKIRFNANHTFTGGEWSLAATHQPPVIPDDGEWHVTGSKLILDFRGDAHDAKRSELVFTVRDDDHIVLRQSSGLETTLERLK
jgi:hypothetical protein